MANTAQKPKKRTADLVRARQLEAQRKRNQMLLIGGVVGVALVAVILIVLVIVQPKNVVTNNAGSYTGIAQSTNEIGAPVLGNKDAKVQLVEFLDFSCPHCYEYKPTMRQIIDEYVKTGKASLTIHHLTYVGQSYSLLAAQAALCAGKQGRYWDMNDALFNIQGTLSARGFTVDQITKTAEGLGLDVGTLQQCMAKGDTMDTINASRNAFDNQRLDGVPALMYSVDGGKSLNFFTDSRGTTAGIPPISFVRENMTKLGVQ